MACDATQVLTLLQAKASETRDATALGTVLVETLRDELDQAAWVGIYWLRGRELVLGPFVGAPTEHTRIPVGTGVCGSAIEQDHDRIVDDVSKESNYLACSAAVKSELVVLIRSHGEVIGQIDLDAETVSAFGPDDHCVVRLVADCFGGLVRSTPYDPDEDAS